VSGAKRLSWGDLTRVLRALEKEGYEVLSPQKNRWGDWFPEPGLPAGWPGDFQNYAYPFLKEAVFPLEEPLFSSGGTGFVFHAAEDRRLAFFGARPCDAEALAYTDLFFTGRFFADSRYRARRRNLFVIAAACRAPCPKSFCVAAQAGPWARKGFDIQVYPAGGDWLAEAATLQGRRLLSAYPDVRREDLLRVRRELEGLFPAPGPLPRHTVRDAARTGWLGARCFRCGACIWLCPTCTCYDQCRFGKDGVKREQDPCLFEGYHRLAGGASLRPTQPHRMDFRYECKFGVGACVGCGRCSVGCVGYAAMEAYLERPGSRAT